MLDTSTNQTHSLRRNLVLRLLRALLDLRLYLLAVSLHNAPHGRDCFTRRPVVELLLVHVNARCLDQADEEKAEVDAGQTVQVGDLLACSDLDRLWESTRFHRL